MFSSQSSAVEVPPISGQRRIVSSPFHAPAATTLDRSVERPETAPMVSTVPRLRLLIDDIRGLKSYAPELQASWASWTLPKMPNPGFSGLLRDQRIAPVLEDLRAGLSSVLMSGDFDPLSIAADKAEEMLAETRLGRTSSLFRSTVVDIGVVVEETGMEL
jgi:hypothetical protein